MATQTSIFMEKEELKLGLIESQIQINFHRLIAWAISYWEQNIEGAVSCSCWLITWSEYEGRSKEPGGGGGWFWYVEQSISGQVRKKRPGYLTVKQIKMLLPHALNAYLCPVCVGWLIYCQPNAIAT